ncbi:hypothetical protein GCM10007079_00640 [Nocardiopsis terrae]|uniref:DUF4178 domain-containing protein n=1 Tax=Nocardiopsis terrae TaxID=372655 RepID=A0ABR9HM82_9ACTN|nr:DUF4178 domain-containing protein [Nocardiopsis terrae]MBE1460115.1 hypothetical protein [Nocardiopsis terrae]GHC69777.1 hypothetical protein GCM10007079_00640 [Nocardiopsis terrae]
MIELLLLLLLIVGIVIGVLIYKQRSRTQNPKQDAPPPPPQDPFAASSTMDTAGDPRNIKAGDMIDWGTERTWIRGTLRLSEGGYVWSEHFLEVEGGKRWLSVDEDPDLELALWTGRPDLTMVPQGKTIELEGVTYKLEEKGSGSYRSEGTTGLKAQGGMDYADYESADGQLLAFERFDHGSWEVSTGTKIAAGTFTIFPGS